MILFLAVVLIETALAAFCIITKSNQVKIRSTLRIAAFLTLVLLTVLPIIDWSFRYYSLTALLLVLSIMGAINLIQPKEEKKTFKAAPVVFKALGLSLLFFVSTLPALLFPQHKGVVDTTGEYKVSTKAYTYTDASRVESYSDTGNNRKLNVQFWYPGDGEETYPLVVFSHGGLGIKSSNESLYREMASHGYVVSSIDHTYQCFFTTDTAGDTIFIDSSYMKELFAEDARSDIRQSYEYYQKWMKIRTEDMDFIISLIKSESDNRNAEKPYSLVDPGKIGVMGHSLGGSAALGIGRMRDDIKAVMALESPYMCDIKGIEDGGFVFTEKVYPVPVLNVYSDSSWKILSERPQYAVNHTMLSGTQIATFNVYISGVGHLGLTDFALSSPFLTSILDGQKSGAQRTLAALEAVNKVALEFFNSYLKDQGEFSSGGIY